MAIVLVSGVLVGCTPQPGGSGGGSALGVDCTTPPNLVPGALLAGCNLVGVNLAGLDLAGADFKGADLQGADLSEANLTGADFEGANLRNANLTGANLTGAVLSGAILIGALFVNALLKGALFDLGRVFGPTGQGGSGTPVGGSGSPGGTGTCSGAFCPGYNEATVADDAALLCRSDLGELTDGQVSLVRTEADLVDHGLRSVVTDSTTSFAGAVLDFSDDGFAIANLRGLSVGRADFSGATLVNPVIACQDTDGARLTGVTIHGTSAKDRAMIYNTDLRNADLAGSVLWLVGLAHVDLSGSDAHSADWTATGVVATNNYPYQSDLAADLTGVNFQGASLGVTANPTNGTSGFWLTEVNMMNPDPPRFYATLVGADLGNAHVRDLIAPNAMFSGVQTAGLVVDGVGSVRGATFDAGWLGVNWSGDYDYTDATCPDGTTGGAAAPCF